MEKKKIEIIGNYLTFIGFNDKNCREMLINDKEMCRIFEKNKKKIPLCSKNQHRLHLLNLSCSVYDYFIIKIVKKLKIIVDIKNKIILDYFKQKKKCVKNCRNLGFGFCFCKDYEGKFL